MVTRVMNFIKTITLVKKKNLDFYAFLQKGLSILFPRIMFATKIGFWNVNLPKTTHFFTVSYRKNYWKEKSVQGRKLFLKMWYPKYIFFWYLDKRHGLNVGFFLSGNIVPDISFWAKTQSTKTQCTLLYFLSYFWLKNCLCVQYVMLKSGQNACSVFGSKF